MISESQINKENKNIVKLKQVKEYFNNILTTFLSNIKLNCNNINSLDYLDSNLKIFGNEVNDIIRDLVNINKEIIESIPSHTKQVHKVNEEINNKKEFFEKWKEFVKINKLKRKYFQKWRKLVEKKIEERHKVNKDIIVQIPLSTDQKLIRLTSDNSSNYIGYPILFTSRGEWLLKKIKGTSNTGKTIYIEHPDLNNSLQIVNRKVFVIIKKTTEQVHKVKFVDSNIKNARGSKFTGIFNNERIEGSNNKFNRLVIYWAYKNLYDENFDKLNSNIKITMNKNRITNKRGDKYKNEYSNKYYVSGSSTICIWKNIMSIKKSAESKNIEFNLENVYVEKQKNYKKKNKYNIKRKENSALDVVENNIRKPYHDMELDDKKNIILCSASDSAYPDGYNNYFLQQKKWGSINIGKKILPTLKYICIYYERKISHIARIIGNTKDKNQYILNLDDIVPLKNPISLGKNSTKAPRGRVYITSNQLSRANTLDDL